MGKKATWQVLIIVHISDKKNNWNSNDYLRLILIPLSITLNLLNSNPPSTAVQGWGQALGT